MLDLGVDLFCSDMPLEAQAFFDKNTKRTISEIDTDEDSQNSFVLEVGSNNNLKL